ncbi:MAG: intradiol ring-cleavage dioxygenase [Anaerolineae bacterium]|nr:intradiol ring-cleavage dioxygenase [Anaerolineae bacterium]
MNGSLLRKYNLLCMLGVVALLLVGTVSGASAQEGGAAEATVVCDGALTTALAEGPHYLAGSPEQASLVEDGMAGVRLLLTGVVLDPQCQPVAGARVDFWQADAAGVYDLQGYTLRGHQYTDAAGRYALETVLPAPYGARPAHIHVKVFAPDDGAATGEELLTTQLYFPDVSPQQTQDRFYAAENQVRVLEPETDGQMHAAYDFVVAYEQAAAAAPEKACGRDSRP